MVTPEVIDLPMEDGAKVVLHHYERSVAPVVLLAHGISSNHRFWDLDADHSLAQWLYAKGYDVWNMDFRGHGDALRDVQGKPLRPNFSFDTYGTKDLPAAIAYILQKTGAEKVAFIGHSMAGMALAVYLATTPEPPLSSAIVVASPLDFRDPDSLIATMLHQRWLMGFRTLPTPGLARWVAKMDVKTPFNLHEMFYNPELVAKETRAKMMREIVSPMWRGENHQLSWSVSGELRSKDGSVVYRDQLQKVDIPMLFLAGRADRVAHPDRVWTYAEAVGSEEKEFIVVSKQNGFSGDYGHLDYGLAEQASAEIFPLFAAWLSEHP